MNLLFLRIISVDYGQTTMLKFHAASIHQRSSNNDSELIKSYSFLPSGFPSRSLKNKEKNFKIE